MQSDLGAKKLILFSGLPRSGSTLLSGILQQNPAFYTSVSSPLFAILSEFIAVLSNHEAGPLVREEERERLSRAIVREYLAGLRGRVIFDKHRAWNAALPLMVKLFPEVVCVSCVRDVSEVVESFEKLASAHPTYLMKLFPADTRHSFQARVEHLVGRKGVVGASLQALSEAYFGHHSRRLLVIKYDSLVSDPRRVMTSLYRHIEEPAFEHDFERVEVDAPEFDSLVGAPGLHHVSGPVRRQESLRILPPDTKAFLSAQSFWETEGNPNDVKIV